MGNQTAGRQLTESANSQVVIVITVIPFIDRLIYSRLARFSSDVYFLTTLTYTNRYVFEAVAYDGNQVINLKCWFSLCCGCVLECSTLNPLMCHLFKSGGFHSICHVVFGVMVS